MVPDPRRPNSLGADSGPVGLATTPFIVMPPRLKKKKSGVEQRFRPGCGRLLLVNHDAPQTQKPGVGERLRPMWSQQFLVNCDAPQTLMSRAGGGEEPSGSSAKQLYSSS